MAEAEITRSETRTETTSPAVDALPRVVLAAATSATRLRGPVLYASLVSLSAAAILWVVCCARFAADSLTSAAACLTALICLAAPGLLLLWLRRSLGELTRIPQRLAEVRKVRLEELAASVRASVETKVEPEARGVAQKLHRQVWSRISALVGLQSAVLGIEEDLLKLAASTRPIAFLASPLAAVLVGVAGAVTVLITAAALVAVAWAALSLIF